jgi:CheY-like chemotaxis protein
MHAQQVSAAIRGKPIENEYVRFDQLSALVIDDISAMRHAIRSQLQSIGMHVVSVACSADEALTQLQSTSYDLIMCDYNLNSTSTGQHFLEYLRTENILSATTLFVMLTAETEYSFVANAVEFMPDDYLLKPCSETKLRSRVERLIDRRTFLMPVLKALNAKQYQIALAACDKLLDIAPDDRRVMDVLKRKAEAQLAVNDYAGVVETYAKASVIRPDTPWIMLGLARTHFALGDLTLATKIASELIEKNKYYVAAYELLAAIHLAQNDEEGAYELEKRASDIFPTSKRYRTVSEAAFLLGKLDDAKTNSEAAIRLSSGSMVEKSDDFLSLAQTQVDMGDHMAAIVTLEKNARKHGDSGVFGVIKGAILAQAYYDGGDHDKAKKLLGRATAQLANRSDSAAMTALGKSALKTGDMISGLRLLTQAVQSSGKDERRIARHVKKSMLDTGHQDKVDDVIDGGRKRILLLIDESTRLMRIANFVEANYKIIEALEIHQENIEALLAAAQLHLLWLKHDGFDDAVSKRAKFYLSTLDKLVPSNQKVMNFYRFYNEIVSQ